MMSNPAPLCALPVLLQAEASRDAELPGALGERSVQPGPFALLHTPESRWSDERLCVHVELLRMLLCTDTDPACVVPNARLTLKLLAQRGIGVDLVLPRPVR